MNTLVIVSQAMTAAAIFGAFGAVISALRAKHPRRKAPPPLSVVVGSEQQQKPELSDHKPNSISTKPTSDFHDMDPLQGLLEDKAITGIVVNGPFKVAIEREGKIEASSVTFRDKAHLAYICRTIAEKAGRSIDGSKPTLETRLEDGSRVHIVFPPLAPEGPYISIKRPPRKILDFADLIQSKVLSLAMAKLLELAVRARINILVSGPTASGKTTLMNIMCHSIDPASRVVIIEDDEELQLLGPGVIRLDSGGSPQVHLVREALRMSPDRIIIGEVRGAEAFDMLQAMNTGLDGSMSTIHANTTRDALTRIENMVQMGNMGLPVAAIRTQIVGALDLIVQVERQRDGGRRVTQVTEVCGMEGGIITLNDIFQFEVLGEGADGRLYGKYHVSRVPPSFLKRLSHFGLDRMWRDAIQEAEAELT